MLEPSIYESIEICHSRCEYMEVPTDEQGIREVASWVLSTGVAHVAGICDEGFRFRHINSAELGGWWWVNPGDWLTLMEGTNQDREFDMPGPHPPWNLSAEEYISGPRLEWGD